APTLKAPSKSTSPVKRNPARVLSRALRRRRPLPRRPSDGTACSGFISIAARTPGSRRFLLFRTIASTVFNNLTSLEYLFIVGSVSLSWRRCSGRRLHSPAVRCSAGSRNSGVTPCGEALEASRPSVWPSWYPRPAVVEEEAEVGPSHLLRNLTSPSRFLPRRLVCRKAAQARPSPFPSPLKTVFRKTCKSPWLVCPPESSAIPPAPFPWPRVKTQRWCSALRSMRPRDNSPSPRRAPADPFRIPPVFRSASRRVPRKTS